MVKLELTKSINALREEAGHLAELQRYRDWIVVPTPLPPQMVAPQERWPRSAMGGPGQTLAGDFPGSAQNRSHVGNDPPRPRMEELPEKIPQARREPHRRARSMRETRRERREPPIPSPQLLDPEVGPATREERSPLSQQSNGRDKRPVVDPYFPPDRRTLQTLL